LPPFDLVPGETARWILEDDRAAVLAVVADAYQLHAAGNSINPDSYFLRFPDKPDARIIALPAYLGGDVNLAGIKWISSFPRNIKTRLPRASAVLILNDYETGYPIACLEAATISAARTAASAALAATTLATRPPRTIAMIGAGVIARTISDYLVASGIRPDSFLVHDLDQSSGESLATYLRNRNALPATFHPVPNEPLRADLVIFATTALSPHVTTPFEPGQLVLNVSLRDLSPEVILAANNVLDDIDHCLKANTSPHLAEQLVGNRDFVNGTLAQARAGDLALDPELPVIFSPFGLGILDIAVGAHVLAAARQTGRTASVPHFFGDPVRW
jgi:ornithine cyclodeaminase